MQVLNRSRWVTYHILVYIHTVNGLVYFSISNQLLGPKFTQRHIINVYNQVLQTYLKRTCYEFRSPACRPDHDQQHCYHHAPTVKPETATAVVELLKMGVRTPETC
jgi:hypothetical protein